MGVSKSYLRDERAEPAPVRPPALPTRLFKPVHAFMALLRAVFVEHRKAQAANRLYLHLRTRSAEDLAKAGLRREDIATEIRVRLYDGS